MEEIQPYERGRMYAALVKSYVSGWGWHEAASYWNGFWPESGEPATSDWVVRGFANIEDEERIFGWRGNAEFWFVDNKNLLSGLLDTEPNEVVHKSRIFELFDTLKRQDKDFLLEGLAKKEWTGEEAVHYLSSCSPALYETSFEYSACDSFSAEEHERLRDFRDVGDLLREVMSQGVTKNFSAGFFGHIAPNKFNRSENGMDLAHPVTCFRAFTRERLEPQAFKPLIFQIADEIEGETVPAALSVQFDDLQRFWKQIPSPSIADLDAYSSPDSGDCKGKLDLPNVPTLFDGTEVVRGITVGQLRGLLDEKNEGTTFCPRLLAAIRAELELNAMRAQVKKSNTFTMTHGKNEKACLKRLIEQQCRELRIFNCNDSDAQKRSGKRTITSQDTAPIERVLKHEREAKNGRR